MQNKDDAMQNQAMQNQEAGKADHEAWQREQLAAQICDMAATIASGMLVSGIDRAKDISAAQNKSVMLVITEACVEQAISIRDEVNRRILGK